MICAFSAGLATSWTSICGLSNRNRCSTASVRALIAPPFRPITRPGRSAKSVTRVPIGVRWISRPPKPARRVSFIRYSFNSTRRTFSTMIRLSFRLTFASAGISCHLFEDDLEVHGVLVPRTASPVRARAKAFRRRPFVGVDHADDHRVGIFFPGELRVRDRALEDLEEGLRCFHRHELRRSRRPDAGSAVRDRLPRHGELADVMPDHLRLDLDRHELLPVVDRDLLPDEVREDRDVAAVCAHGLLGPVRADLLDEREAFLVNPAHERPPRSGGQELDDLFERHRLHLIERVPTVRELLLAPGLDQARALPQLPSRGLGQAAHLLPRHRQDLRRFSFSRFGFGDIRPTFRPGGASYPTVDGFPTCWWDPPPCGWSTGFIATPRTLNAGLLKERYENHFLPAFVKGLSPRPAPATAPIVARQSGWNVWNCPEGSWTTVRSAWLTTTACVPAARTNFPPSPGIASML